MVDANAISRANPTSRPTEADGAPRYGTGDDAGDNADDDADADATSDELGSTLRAAQQGDEKAFRVLYRHMQPRLLRYLATIVRRDAEDVAADVWMQVVRKLPQFRGDFDHFRGWVTTIARNRGIDHNRRAARLRIATEPVEDLTELIGPDDPAAAVLTRIATNEALKLIGTLPPDQAEAVLLRIVLALTPAEAGRVLGKRPAAVRVACHRGLRVLARRFAAKELPVGGRTRG